MIRQYIGARYVPKFSDTNNGVWDASYGYDALEIVKYGNNFYTSKKPVPSGISINNDTYWIKTGDYNGAIAALESQIHIKSPMDYGAVGDGVADDSAAFQSAVDDADIILIDAKFRIKDISITHDLLMIGCGGELLTLPADNSAPFENMLTVREANLLIDNVHFTCTAKYTGESITTRNSCIDIEDADQIVINNCYFKGLGYSYANITTPPWNYHAVVVRCVDAVKFEFSNNTLYDCRGDELFMVTPHTSERSYIKFSGNSIIKSTTGASINLLANYLEISDNYFEQFIYQGSIFNICGDFVDVINNDFVNCNVNNVIDAAEDAAIYAEHCNIANNNYRGACANFARVISSDLKVINNYVEGNSLIIQDLTAKISDHSPASLLNDQLRANAKFICEDNTVIISGTINNVIIRFLAVNVYGTPIYNKNDIGVSAYASVKGNSLIFGNTSGNVGTIYAGNTVKKLIVSENLIVNPNIDNMAGSAKYILEMDNRSVAGKGDNCIIENNTITDTISQIVGINAVGLIESAVFTKQLTVNGNYTDGKPFAIAQVYDTLIKYQIES